MPRRSSGRASPHEPDHDTPAPSSLDRRIVSPYSTASTQLEPQAVSPPSSASSTERNRQATSPQASPTDMPRRSEIRPAIPPSPFPEPVCRSGYLLIFRTVKKVFAEGGSIYTVVVQSQTREGLEYFFFPPSGNPDSSVKGFPLLDCNHDGSSYDEKHCVGEMPDDGWPRFAEFQREYFTRSLPAVKFESDPKGYLDHFFHVAALRGLFVRAEYMNR